MHHALAAAGLAVLRALKARSGRGVWSEPALLALLPAPHYEPLQRTFDLLIPDDSALAAYVVADDRRAILASIIAVKRGGHIAQVTTHAAIADLVPEAALARDWATARAACQEAGGGHSLAANAPDNTRRRTAAHTLRGSASGALRSIGCLGLTPLRFLFPSNSLLGRLRNR